MNLEKINEIINNYNKLQSLVETKIEFIKKLNSQYSTKKGIEEISFDEENVLVKCDDSCRGCYSYFLFTFPIIWLSKPDDELEKLVVTQKELKEEEERKIKEEKQLKEKELAKQKELEQHKSVVLDAIALLKFLKEEQQRYYYEAEDLMTANQHQYYEEGCDAVLQLIEMTTNNKT